jgi:hypothetical protein
MQKLQHSIDELNVKLYNPVGLHILWPRKVAFMFVSISVGSFVLPSANSLFVQLEIEYYVSTIRESGLHSLLTLAIYSNLSLFSALPRFPHTTQ